MRRALETLPWVREAKVDLKKKEARISVEEGRFNAEEVIDVIKKAGFGAEIKEAPKKITAFNEASRVDFRVVGMTKTKSGVT